MKFTVYEECGQFYVEQIKDADGADFLLGWMPIGAAYEGSPYNTGLRGHSEMLLSLRYLHRNHRLLIKNQDIISTPFGDYVCQDDNIFYL